MTIIDNLHVHAIKDTHITDIKAGDLVLHTGHDGSTAIRTVCENDISRGGFMGTTIFGDSYRLGYKPVNLVILYNPLVH